MVNTAKPLSLGPSALADRDGWLAWRTNTLGASDASVILGVNKWQSPLKLYAKKIGVMDSQISNSEAASWGHRLQRPILEGWSDATGLPCREWEIGVVNPTYPWLHATPDAIVSETIPKVTDRLPDVVQAKATSLERDWEDGVPASVFAQVQQEMLVSRSRLAHVAVLFSGKRLETFEVEFDQSWCEDLLIPKTKAFHDGLEAGIPPQEICPEDHEALVSLWPTSVDTADPVELPGHLIESDEDLQRLRSEIRELTQRKKLLENEFKAALEANAEGILPNGVTYSWKSSTRKYKATAAREVETRTLRRKKA